MKIRRYGRLAGNIILSNFKRLNHPYKLTYAITSRCNYRCQTCNIWQKPPQNELSIDEIEKFFARSPHFSWVDLTGGEVFMRKDFGQIVQTILGSCRNLLLLHFPTNGYLTDSIVSTVEKIRKMKPEKLIITVSMDGDRKLNDDIRGIPGGWERQIETFKRLKALKGVQTVLGMTLSALNADQFPRAFQAVKQKYPRLTTEDFHVNIAHLSPHYYGNAGNDLVQGSEEKIITAMNQYREQRKFRLHPVSYLEKQYLKRVESYLRTHKTPLRCQALSASCFLDPAGRVYPCSIYDRCLGDLHETAYDLHPLWDSEPARLLQKEIRSFQCPHCWTPCEAYQTILGSLFKKKNVSK